MSCDWCDGPTQQLRGRPRQRAVQGRPRRQNTSSPPKFSTNSAKVACKVCAPYYANKISRRTLVNTEVLNYNKSFAGKSAKLAVEELCGENWDCSRSSGASTYSSAYSTSNDIYSDDFITQLAISQALQDDATLFNNLYEEHVAASDEISQLQLQGFEIAMQPSLHNSAISQPVNCNSSCSASNHDGTGPSILNLGPSDFSFPTQSTIDPCPSNPLASVHLWSRGADSILAPADPATSIYSRAGHVCETLASYSQMFSASWMPQLPSIQDNVMAQLPPLPDLGQDCAAVEEEPVDEDFEHLSQMSEQDWYSREQVEVDDFVLV